MAEGLASEQRFASGAEGADRSYAAGVLSGSPRKSPQKTSCLMSATARRPCRALRRLPERTPSAMTLSAASREKQKTAGGNRAGEDGRFWDGWDSTKDDI